MCGAHMAKLAAHEAKRQAAREKATREVRG